MIFVYQKLQQFNNVVTKVYPQRKRGEKPNGKIVQNHLFRTFKDGPIYIYILYNETHHVRKAYIYIFEIEKQQQQQQKKARRRAITRRKTAGNVVSFVPNKQNTVFPVFGGNFSIVLRRRARREVCPLCSFAPFFVVVVVVASLWVSLTIHQPKTIMK